MAESFSDVLKVGGKANTLGRASEVIEQVLQNKARLPELYDCIFDEDPWVRMRAIDALEKICRTNPNWIEPYIDRINNDLSTSMQASILWHIAEIYGEVELTYQQQLFAIKWLKQILSTPHIDWIVASNAMKTLVQFTHKNLISKADAVTLLGIQQHHKSQAVVKRAKKLQSEL